MSFSILPPPITPLAAILPSEPLLLMGAGPVPIPQAVAQANGVIINHLGPTMDRVIQNVKSSVSSKCGPFWMFQVKIRVPAEIVVDPKIVGDYVFPGSISGTWTHMQNIKAAGSN